MKKFKFLKLAEILRYKIQHFLAYFQDYLYHNAIENAWDSLISNTKNSKTFKDIIFVNIIFMLKKFSK